MLHKYFTLDQFKNIEEVLDEMKKLIVTLMITLMFTGCEKEEKINEASNTKTTIVETIPSENSETEGHVSDEYMEELESNS